MIKLENVSKVFGTGAAGLSDISLNIDKGEFVFLMGHTGSGKTTLLRLLTRELMPTKGLIIVGGWDLGKLPSSKVAHLRKRIGVVFQDLKLLMDRTIWENILLPLEVASIPKDEASKRGEELLARVGINAHRNKFPVQLSGGELQRAAIARALTLAPDILLADEPTGNLDSQTAFEIVDLLDRINQTGTTVVIATHNLDIVKKHGKRVIILEKGRLIKDDKKTTKEPNGQKRTEEKKQGASESASAFSFVRVVDGKKTNDDNKKEEKNEKKSMFIKSSSKGVKK